MNPCDGGHDGMRTPEVFWRLKSLGTMYIPPTVDGDAGYTLVFANCPRCHTTLAIEVTDDE